MSQTNGESKLRGAALIAAFVVIAAWLGLLSWLTFNTGSTEVVWARLLSVLGSLEAVAFAAAGALFGTTVQRQRVEEARAQTEKAEERASQAEKTSSENVQAATNGRALAAAVKARLKTRAQGINLETPSGGELQRDTRDDLLELAQKLFPD